MDQALGAGRVPAIASSPVDLGSVFDPVFLGAETARLERLLAETAARGLIREAPGFRCFSLTPEGAAVARALRGGRRWITISVVIAVIVLGIIVWRMIG